VHARDTEAELPKRLVACTSGTSHGRGAHGRENSQGFHRQPRESRIVESSRMLNARRRQAVNVRFICAIDKK
jgi:hypothetical protein